MARKQKRISSVDDDDGDDDKHWHVSRRIPVAFIASGLVYCLAQIGVFGWYASQLNVRVENLEKTQIQLAPQSERLTRLEEKMGTIQSGVTDLKTDLKGMSQTFSTLLGKSLR